MRTEPTIIYIAGYSRSGSTILDMLLGSHPDIVSTGELTFLLDDAETPARLCSCGRPYRDCPRFGPWLNARPGHEACKRRAVFRGVEARVGAADGLPLRTRVEYQAFNRDLFGHIARDAGASFVLDSSKSARDAAGRPQALARIAGLDVRILHLTRDPRAVISSYCERGRNWVAEGHRRPRPLDSFRPILGWRRANRIARGYAAQFGPDRYLRVKYEDLMAAPAAELVRIGRFLGIDTTSLARRSESGAAFSAHHNVGGNRTRLLAQPLRIGSPVAPILSPLHEAAFRLTTRRTAIDLGYA